MITKLIILLLAFTVQSVRPTNCLKFDILLLGDMSNSVQGNEGFVASAFVSFCERFDLDEQGVKIGAMIFADDVILLSHLTSNKEAIIKVVSGIKTTATFGSTNLLSAYYTSIDEFALNGRPFYQKLIIIVSDGDVDNKEIVEHVSKQLKRSGIKIFSVLINDGTKKEEFMELISDKYFHTNYSELEKTLQAMDICI